MGEDELYDTIFGSIKEVHSVFAGRGAIRPDLIDSSSSEYEDHSYKSAVEEQSGIKLLLKKTVDGQFVKGPDGKHKPINVSDAKKIFEQREKHWQKAFDQLKKEISAINTTQRGVSGYPDDKVIGKEDLGEACNYLSRNFDLNKLPCKLAKDLLAHAFMVRMRKCIDLVYKSSNNKLASAAVENSNESVIEVIDSLDDILRVDKTVQENECYKSCSQGVLNFLKTGKDFGVPFQYSSGEQFDEDEKKEIHERRIEGQKKSKLEHARLSEFWQENAPAYERSLQESFQTFCNERFSGDISQLRNMPNKPEWLDMALKRLDKRPSYQINLPTYKKSDNEDGQNKNNKQGV